MAFRVPLFLFSLLALNPLSAATDHYVGAETCARCHQAISQTQSKTAMAQTWHGAVAKFPPLSFDEGAANALRYEARVGDGHATFSVSNGTTKLSAPVEAMVGGNRHGLSFLLRLNQAGGLALERPAMLEARYALSHTGALVLSPGFDKDPPSVYEDKLGRVLSPQFETRCLTCHGQPNTLGAGNLGGVRCESCHGAASAHVDSMTGTAPGPMVKPTHLEGEKSLQVCAQCHSGLSASGHADPLPQDVLVSSQVPALRNSQCFIQSGGQLTCTGCHNPHADSATVSQSTVATCLGCHAVTVPKHAAICPVNQTQGCVGCHMPTVQSDSFRLTDHWIRVVPGSGPKIENHDPSLQSQVIPKREYLRSIVVEDDQHMKAVTDRLAKGEPFETVAHDLSIDPNAPGGGFIGEVALSDMDPKLAAAVEHLDYGANSAVIANGDKRIILHRLSRDFKWNADRLFREAQDLEKHGDRPGALRKDKEALDEYPYFLRGMILMGTLLGQAGDANHASQVLQFAAQSYPQDAVTEFNLALTLGNQPAAQIEAFRRTIELDPDMVAAYQSLGAALYSSGQPNAAIDIFRRGLQIDPLSAVLYFDLGLALKDQGDGAGANQALALASRLDPQIAARKTH